MKYLLNKRHRGNTCLSDIWQWDISKFSSCNRKTKKKTNKKKKTRTVYNKITGSNWVLLAYPRNVKRNVNLQYLHCIHNRSPQFLLKRNDTLRRMKVQYYNTNLYLHTDILWHSMIFYQSILCLSLTDIIIIMKGRFSLIGLCTAVFRLSRPFISYVYCY